ncbi:RrF2 family transcriptional regulator [Chloroflexota bacterium]
MKLSTRARYGTRALLDLALTQSNAPVHLKEIAQRQDVSLHYLEHIISPLIAAGIIRSTRGSRGGIQLNRPTEDIKLKEVIQLLEGSITPVECIENPDSCSRSDACATRDFWGDVNKAIDDVLEATTLQDLVERQHEKDHSKQAMYHV